MVTSSVEVLLLSVVHKSCQEVVEVHQKDRVQFRVVKFVQEAVKVVLVAPQRLKLLQYFV